MITNPCQEESHQQSPSGMNRPATHPQTDTDSGYSSIDATNPLWGTLQDTDDETLQVYGHAWPMHSERGRPIIDGSLEYWEAMQQPRASPAASCPTIMTRSGRLILEGSPDNVEVIEDGVVEEMARVESEEGMRQGGEDAVIQGSLRGQIDLVDGDSVVDEVLEDTE